MSDLFKNQQERECDLLKIQQEREREEMASPSLNMRLSKRLVDALLGRGTGRSAAVSHVHDGTSGSVGGGTERDGSSAVERQREVEVSSRMMRMMQDEEDEEEEVARVKKIIRENTLKESVRADMTHSYNSSYYDHGNIIRRTRIYHKYTHRVRD